MQIRKNADDRRNEILDVAESFFMTEGYAQTTIESIIQKIGIAKGTFYYHFSSKEDVMDAVVMRIVDQIVEGARQIVKDTQLTAPEKLFHIIMGQISKPSEEEDMINELHLVDNAQLHQKSLVETIIHLTPVFTEVIEQGIEEGYFSTQYPRETIEFLLVSSQFLFDEGIFTWSEEELQTKALAFTSIMEKVLHAEEGSFTYILKKLSN